MTVPPADDQPDAELIDSLVQVSFEVTALLSRTASDNGLSLTQLRVLAILRDREPTMAQLATHLGLERSSVSGLVDRSVGRGLVQRETSTEDRRSVRVSLTADGHRLAAALTAEVTVLLAPLTADLGAADRRRLGQLLDRMLTRSAW